MGTLTRRGALRVVAGGAALIAAGARAQAYPDRAIRITVPFAPGGTSDVIVRPMCDKLTALLGQAVVADYVPGAGGTVAAAKVANSPPDGYTLLCASTGGLATGPHVTKVSYDPVASFTHIGQAASSQYVIVVLPASPIKNLNDLLARARARPAGMNYGSPGAGSLGHLAMELLKSQAHLDITHVAYRGQAPMSVDLLGGRLDMAVAGLGIVPAIKEGRLRAIGMTGAQRSASLPEAPTIAEQGIAGFDAAVFWGLSAPAGTPPAIVERLNTALRAVVQEPEIRAFWISNGQDPVAGSAAQFDALIRRENEKWRSVVRDAHISTE